ncbi:MAG TPA: FAD-dependent oxidoreductase [Geminicoccaceae bacterium]|nr:FAD-dependent oxidoreductase [Geminicoccaceae bacterium]
MAELRDTEIVVVGGGAIGCAVAYRLTEAGKHDVLVVEKEAALASVTTAQAAGLVGQVRSSVDRVRLAMDSVATFRALQVGPEPRPAWREVGSLRIALEDARALEFERLIRTCRAAGLDVELLDPAAARARWPGLVTAPAKAILWCASDGYLQPYDLAMAYQARARERGARFVTGVRVTGITLQDGAVAAVETDRGRIRCQTVIDAAGAHAYHVARMAGLELPIVPVRHQYVVTVPTGGIRPDWPCLRVPDATLYGRPDVNALLLGGWEPEALSTDPRSYPLTGEPPPIEPDWPVLADFAERLAPLYPPVREAGVRHVFRGWPTFTPDGRFVVGASRRVRGFVMAGGCNAHGVSGSAGIGRHVVEALLEPRTSPYLQSLSPDRFGATGWEWGEARRRAQAIYETYYHIGH